MEILDSVDEVLKQRQWTSRDVLPALLQVESNVDEPVKVPSADILLSRGIADYTILPKVLGKGKFSTVFVASKHGELSAIKHTALFPHHQLISTRLLREPTLLAELPPHPNLVEVKETIRTPGHFYLVEEFLDGYVTLEALLTKFAPSGAKTSVLPLDVADNILSQLLSAVRAIHHPLQICHRDIKPENILVHETTHQLKLLDFGLATHYSKSEPKLSTCCGSPAFHCPEIVKALASSPGSVTYWGPEVDAWTCGVTMLRVLTGVRYPLGSSHSSIRTMAIRAQRAISLIPLSDESSSNEILGRMLRDKVGKLLEMDSLKRIRNFNDLTATSCQGLLSERGEKKFKSTTFVPTTASHTIELPLLKPSAAERVDISLYRSQTKATEPYVSEIPRRASTERQPQVPQLRSQSPPVGHQHRGLPSTAKSENATGSETPSDLQSSGSCRLIMLNPSNHPIPRVLSYIKYCLRCAGILYHCWQDNSANFAGSHTGESSARHQHAASEEIARGLDLGIPPVSSRLEDRTDRSDGWAHVHVFQCVIEFKPELQSVSKPLHPPKGFVSSLLAAFGRRKSSVKEDSIGQAPSPGAHVDQSGRSPRQGSRQSSGARSAISGDDKHLSFYMVIRFPKSGRSSSRPAYSRANTLQDGRQRASSAAAAITRASVQILEASPSSLASATNNEECDSATSAQLNAGHPVGPKMNEESQRQRCVETVRSVQDPSNLDSCPPMGKENCTKGIVSHIGESNSHSTSVDHALTIDTSTGLSENVQGPPYVSAPLSAGTPRSRHDSRASAHLQRVDRNKVFIQINDLRAVEVIRAALSVGGTQDLPDFTTVPRPSSVKRATTGLDLKKQTHDRSTATGNGVMQSSAFTTDTAAGSGNVRSVSRTRGARAQSYAGLPTCYRSLDPSVDQRSPQQERFDIGQRNRASRDASILHEMPCANLTEQVTASDAPKALCPSSEQKAADSFRMIADTSSTDRELAQYRYRLGIPSHSPECDQNDVGIDSNKATFASAKPLGVSPVAEEPATMEDFASRLGSPVVPPSTARAESQWIEVITNLQRTVNLICHLPPQTRLAVHGSQAQSGQEDRDFEQVHTLLQQSLNQVYQRLARLTESKSAAETAELESLLDQHSFSLFGTLFPLLGLTNLASEREVSSQCVTLLGRVASPREMLIAVQERLEILAKAHEIPERYDLTQDETAVILHATQPNEIESKVQYAAQTEIIGLFDLLSHSVDRIKAKSGAPIMHSLSASITNVLINLNNFSDGEATGLAVTVASLLRTSAQWARSIDGSHDCESQLLIVLTLFRSIGPRLYSEKLSPGTSSAEQLFHKRNRHYQPGAKLGLDTITRRGQGWNVFPALIQELSIDLLGSALPLAHGCIPTSHEQRVDISDPRQRLHGFLLYVLLAYEQHSSPLALKTSEEALDLMERSLPLLTAVFVAPSLLVNEDHASKMLSGGSTGVTDDAWSFFAADIALMWMMWCLDALTSCADKYSTPSPTKEYRHLVDSFADLLANYAATSPHSAHRHIAYVLLREVLMKLVKEESALIDLLRGIIMETPYMQLRVAGVGLVKDLLSDNARAPLSDQDAAKWRELLNEGVFNLPFSLPAAKKMEDNSLFWESCGPLLTQVLNLAYLLLRRRSCLSWLFQGNMVAAALEENIVDPVRLLLRSADTEQLPAHSPAVWSSRSGLLAEQDKPALLSTQCSLVENALDRVLAII